MPKRLPIVVTGVETANPFKEIVQYRAKSVAGPGDTNSRDVFVYLSLGDLAQLLGAVDLEELYAEDVATIRGAIRVLRALEAR